MKETKTFQRSVFAGFALCAALALAGAAWERLEFVDFGVVRLGEETVKAWSDAGFSLRGTAQFERV